MASLGGWVRLFVGVLLSVEVLRQWLTGNGATMYGNALAASFIALTVAYFAFRF